MLLWDCVAFRAACRLFLPPQNWLW